MSTRALVNVPKRAKRGEVIEIRALVQHIMETGFRRDYAGKAFPRDIIGSLTCTYNGTEVFRAELFPAISANPFLTFSTVATESGEIVLTWSGDNGFRHTETATITVE
jgi:sulfur-oxidizing protein SoxZ